MRSIPILLIFLWPSILTAQSKFPQPTVVFAINVLDCATCLYATNNINDALKQASIQPTFLLTGISEKNASYWIEKQFQIRDPKWMIDNELFASLCPNQVSRVAVLQHNKVLYSETITKADKEQILQKSIVPLQSIGEMKLDTNVRLEHIHSMEILDQVVVIHDYVFKTIHTFDLQSGRHLAEFDIPNDLYDRLYYLSQQDTAKATLNNWKKELQSANIALYDLKQVQCSERIPKPGKNSGPLSAPFGLHVLLQANFLNHNEVKVIPTYFMLTLNVNLEINQITHLQDPESPYYLKTWGGYLVDHDKAIFSIDKSGKSKKQHYLAEWTLNGDAYSMSKLLPNQMPFQSKASNFTACEIEKIGSKTYHYFDRWPCIYEGENSECLPDIPTKIKPDNKFKLCQLLPSDNGFWVIYWHQYQYYIRHYQGTFSPAIPLDFGQNMGDFVTFDAQDQKLYALWNIMGRKGSKIFELPEVVVP